MKSEYNDVRNHEETISALMDGETEELELRRLLRYASDNNGILETWDRYNKMRSALRKEDSVPVSAASTQRIMAALEAEMTHTSPFANPTKKYASKQLHMLGRFAVAASVALAVFLGLQSTLFNQDGAYPGAGQGGLTASSSIDISVGESAAVSASPTFDAEAQLRLNEYIRSVSIQYEDTSSETPLFNILQDSQLIRQVNQIEN
jgi:sigma-E factor negative regulatory protein RseA